MPDSAPSTAADALDKLFLATAQALGEAAQNAVDAQQQFSVTAQAATTVAISTMVNAHPSAVADKTVDEAPSGEAGKAALKSAGAPPPGDTDNLTRAARRAAQDAVDPMLALVMLNVGGLAMLDAIQNLRGVALVAQTANALALSKGLNNPDGRDWAEVILASERSVTAATEHLGAVCGIAVSFTQRARGGV